MLVYLQTDLFASPAQTLVNTVNTVGVMGKGIAKSFKERYPEMFREYKQRCDRGELRIGTLLLWRGADKWVLNFPTKTTWRLPSTLAYVQAGLEKFVASYEELGITSISFPPLGCGNGNLDWEEVKPVMESYLRDLPIQVYVHDRHVAPDFIPEHLEKVPPAADFRHFLDDIRALTVARNPAFETLDRGSRFTASLHENGDLEICDADRHEKIPHEEIETAWSALQAGLLTADQLSGGATRRQDEYLFGLLSRLPYVQAAPVKHLRRNLYEHGHGLFFRQRLPSLHVEARREKVQRKLWA
ncbi:MAG TPA: macro domain-containing protein [Thermoanaerobaculia bacterium]|nr:macro domain-containing protein [Thermoanaerobaculia bacterium]